MNTSNFLGQTGLYKLSIAQSGMCCIALFSAYLVQTNNADAWKQAFKHYAENLCLKNEMHDTVMEISNEYDIGVTVSRYLDVFHDIIGD